MDLGKVLNVESLEKLFKYLQSQIIYVEFLRKGYVLIFTLGELRTGVVRRPSYSEFTIKDEITSQEEIRRSRFCGLLMKSLKSLEVFSQLWIS